MLYHPSMVLGTVRLTRKHLSALKQKIEMYLQGENDLLSLLDDPSTDEIS